MEEIFRNKACFGGVICRVVSDGITCQVQEKDYQTKKPTWITLKTVPYAEFKEFEKTNLGDPYDDNPAYLYDWGHQNNGC